MKQPPTAMGMVRMDLIPDRSALTRSGGASSGASPGSRSKRMVSPREELLVVPGRFRPDQRVDVRLNGWARPGVRGTEALAVAGELELVWRLTQWVGNKLDRIIPLLELIAALSLEGSFSVAVRSAVALPVGALHAGRPRAWRRNAQA